MMPGSAMLGGRCSRSYQRFHASTASASQSTEAKMMPVTSTASGGSQLDQPHQRDPPVGAALVVVVPRTVGVQRGPRLRVVGAVEDLRFGPELATLHADAHLGVGVAVRQVEVPRGMVGRPRE